jgi:formylglycine-generating enzyme required for sulfatase activity
LVRNQRLIVGGLGSGNRKFGLHTRGPRRLADFKECATGCPTMVVVPAGKFMMGSPEVETDRTRNEGPQHEVMIAKAFAVSKTEVTFAE